MNFKPLAAVFIASIWSAALACSAVRAEYIPAEELEQMRFAARWPDTQPKQTPHPAVVRVIATDRNSLSLGSGTLIDANDDFGLIVTNWHVVRDAVGPVEVVFADGFHSMASIIRTDKEWDLAALLIWKPPAVQPVTLSTVPPRPGEMLTIAGYGSGDYKMQSGPCVEYLAPVPGKPLEIVELAAAARHGDSGGPILNSRGELAGVLFGEGGGHTDGSYGGRVHQFLQLAAIDLRSLPQSDGSRNRLTNPNVQLAQRGANSGGTGAAANPSQTQGGGIPVYAAAQFDGGINTTNPENGAGGWSDPASPRIANRSAAGTSSQPNRVGKPLTLAAEPPERSAAPEPGPTNRRPTFIWLDEAKSFLAAIGVAAVALQLLRWAGGR